MDPDRWRKIEALYEAARGLEPARRAAFLQESCAGDETLRREVESLLFHGENAGRFLHVPAPLEVGQPDGKWITIQLPEGFGVISPDGARTKVPYEGALDFGSACGWSRDGSTLFLAYLTPQGRVLSAFDVATGTERRVRDLGPLHFSYLAYHSAGLSPSPDGKSLAASTWSLRFEPWILDGLEPPRSFWARLFQH